MEPLHPDVRAELKRANPRLTDAIIDEYERLTSLRTSLDPQTAGDRIGPIDAQREALLREHMPSMASIHNAMIEKRRSQAASDVSEARVKVRIVSSKPPKQDVE